MSALYRGQYQGVVGFGGGVYYIGRDKILGRSLVNLDVNARRRDQRSRGG
jgi:hypothetical protein